MSSELRAPLNCRAALDTGLAIYLHIGHYWSGASERGCSTLEPS